MKKAMLYLLLICSCLSVRSYSVNAKENYKSWKQYDNEWGEKKLGDSGTMSGYGCLITALAIAEVDAGVRNEESFNPGVLLQELDENGYITHDGNTKNDGLLMLDTAFSKTNNLNFFKKETIDLSGKSIEEISNIFKELIKQNYYLIVRLKGHFVTVNREELSDEEVMIYDPGSNNKKLSKYIEDIQNVDVYEVENIQKNMETKTNKSNNQTDQTADKGVILEVHNPVEETYEEDDIFFDATLINHSGGDTIEIEIYTFNGGYSPIDIYIDISQEKELNLTDSINSKVQTLSSGKYWLIIRHVNTDNLTNTELLYDAIFEKL